MKKDYAPGKWGASVSGHVDTGEDYDTAIVREAREELGIILPEIPKKLFKLDAWRQTEQEFVWIYEYQYQGPFQLHPEEVSDGRWFSIQEVNQWIGSRTEDLAKSFIFIWEMREQKMRKASTIISWSTILAIYFTHMLCCISARSHYLLAKMREYNYVDRK